MFKTLPWALVFFATTVLHSGNLTAQNLTLPPDGDNQKSSVTQYVGLVRVTVDYNSPDVHGPTGEDRAGKIWGTLVPYGLTDLGFGPCTSCPWRAGANENTVLTVSHDVRIDGQKLPAGSYGMHMIAGEKEWTAIFSRNSTAWGSFFYDPKEDALRVKVKPARSEYHEWLTYDFTERKPDQATLTLKWENLQVPMTIKVDDIADLYLAKLRQELQTSLGFTAQSWAAAAQYALQNKKNLPEALHWAETAVTGGRGGFGQENFNTLATLARLQEANNKGEEAKKTMDRALNHPTAGPIQLHQYGRELQRGGKNAEALSVFELNARRHPNAWPVNVGLARGHAGMGHNAEALKFFRLALNQAPDEVNKTNIQNLIKQLEEGKNIN